MTSSARSRLQVSPVQAVSSSSCTTPSPATSESSNMASDIRTAELKKPIDIAEYLFRRLHEVGVRGVHGVPGDYNLVGLSLP